MRTYYQEKEIIDIKDICSNNNLLITPSEIVRKEFEEIERQKREEQFQRENNPYFDITHQIINLN